MWPSVDNILLIVYKGFDPGAFTSSDEMTQKVRWTGIAHKVRLHIGQIGLKNVIYL